VVQNFSKVWRIGFIF